MRFLPVDEEALKVYSISGEKSDYMNAKIISKIASDPDIPIQEVSIKTIELTRKISKRDLFVKLNSILYSISVCQSKYDTIGSDYYLKKIGEGKTKHHARKCLSRQISNQIYKILFRN